MRIEASRVLNDSVARWSVGRTTRARCRPRVPTWLVPLSLTSAVVLLGLLGMACSPAHQKPARAEATAKIPLAEPGAGPETAAEVASEAPDDDAGPSPPSAPPAPSTAAEEPHFFIHTCKPIRARVAAASAGPAEAFSRVDLHSCRKAPEARGPGHAAIVFGPSGAVESVTVDGGPAAGTPSADCIAKRFCTARVAPFGGAPVKVGKSFVID